MVDSKPIRVYKNYIDQGVGYPNSRSMEMYSTIWNGSNWATRGGQDKLNMTYAPFVASFKDYMIDACVWNGGDPSFCSAVSESNWWNKDEFKSLTSWQRGQFDWVRKNHLVYDYCQNPAKRNKFKECSLPKMWLYFHAMIDIWYICLKVVKCESKPAYRLMCSVILIWQWLNTNVLLN